MSLISNPLTLNPASWLDRLFMSQRALEHADLVAANFPAPPAAAPPAAPQTQEQMTVPGAWTPDMAAAGAAETTRQQTQQFFNELAAKLPTSSTSTSPWLYGAGAVALISALVLVRKKS